MENIQQLTTTNNNKKAQDEVRALKEDIQNIISRLGTLKNYSKDIVSEQLGELMTRMNDLSDQGVEKGKEYVHTIEDSIKRRPMMSALYAFGAGVLLAALLKR
ncbi:MAG: hypothetical protein K0R02_921 [Rickettsiaceae bacterium]|jgi:ElaB/YqjD/DUF883 family membrane-anchored ribosome-binding protein|nr:hypothetical protein [Rickettsiaceae bacterium]